MQLEFSQFGQKFTARSGILELMDDLGRAMTDEPDMLMLGGGNPAAVPAMQAIWRGRMAELLADQGAFDAMLANYDPPVGNPSFRRSLAGFLRQHCGWDVGPENVAIVNGGQTAFFFLFNALAGSMKDGGRRQILLPITPEYIVYADQGVEGDLVVACRPIIRELNAHTFKYAVDFSAVETALARHRIAAIAVSRPTNPSGNVLTVAEVDRLTALARQHGIPLVLDNAYGAPFPGVIFGDPAPVHWQPDGSHIFTLSLSKLGLPGTRTAAVVASPQIVEAVAALTAIVGLANGNVGQRLVQPLLDNGRLAELSGTVLRPFYAEKSSLAQAWLREFLGDGLPWAIHASEGAFFHWLWLKDLPITSGELYQRLKRRKVIVVPGHYFFFGTEDAAGGGRHRDECLRLNFSGPAEVVREGFRRIADEVRDVYAGR